LNFDPQQPPRLSCAHCHYLLRLPIQCTCHVSKPHQLQSVSHKAYSVHHHDLAVHTISKMFACSKESIMQVLTNPVSAAISAKPSEPITSRPQVNSWIVCITAPPLLFLTAIIMTKIAFPFRHGSRIYQSLHRLTLIFVAKRSWMT
uniref:C2H2-type domain-containing protein n=1 Tax=Haemonchus placei TaxID=6290 RepID=A0A0N4XAT8_HAEPC